jgi:hypothetical protein
MYRSPQHAGGGVCRRPRGSHPPRPARPVGFELVVRLPPDGWVRLADRCAGNG